MRATFLIAGSVMISIAAIFHMYIFILESVKWSNPKTWKAFSLPSQEHADIIHSMAFNQGFYNLFLALGATIGVTTLGLNSTIAFTLMIFASSCMIGAGLVLFFSVKTSRKAAIIQAGPPLLGVLFVFIGFAL
ncbi:MAG TPA: DUF1304 domain-containing protein [Candidatus Saccharimonadales bacterium]